eukprot:CAMPEP_0183309958 /NCGR_PEP_ID=MMETSP0160_2-20130417/27565_1 /TAXON_ID=2839 ORGANISM="Odontella Sinensis, Strain Grunow 1884" /NCGR_SAMPLE_ID=MMETSP0160_2 /ASSEMBLY_ACC=CAM_ASM_000250 /LENGTH=80 /DNA_ID=CAMNT_0025474069 /DNA_START=6 /DNA_END=248 /DNA_ORIENTATION=+
MAPSNPANENKDKTSPKNDRDFLLSVLERALDLYHKDNWDGGSMSATTRIQTTPNQLRQEFPRDSLIGLLSRVHNNQQGG